MSLGNHFAGLKGSVAAVVGLLTPVFVTTVALTALFVYGIQSAAVVELLPRTVLPAALALIVVGALSLSRDLVGFKAETALAVAGFLTAFLLHLPPGVVLLLGGIVGIFIFRDEGGEKRK